MCFVLILRSTEWLDKSTPFFHFHEEEFSGITDREEAVKTFKSRLPKLVTKYGLRAKIHLLLVADNPEDHPLGGRIIETCYEYIPNRDGRWYGGPMH